jgi:hypothetical protein
MKFVRFAAVTGLTFASSAHAASWPIGVEREVDEGVYMQVVAVEQGWRIWRSETKGGVSCKAVKSARGRPHPEPVGVSWMMFNGTPFLEISWNRYGAKFSYGWSTVHYDRIRLSYRAPGERFWEDRNDDGFNADEVGEKLIELTITSYEYGAILVGRAEETAAFDLAGLNWAKAEVLKCEGRVPDV